MTAAIAPARSVSDLLDAGRTRLRGAGIATADLDARLLLSDALGLDAAGLLLGGGQAVPDDRRRLIEARLDRRLAGEPVHRILGHRPFYAHDFRLSPATLEPRPDTEILVDLCRRPIEACLARKGECLFADVGTGTGAIAVSLLALFPRARAIAIDICADALAIATLNAADAGVAGRLTPLLGDHLSAVDLSLDMVVSNPPYIPTGAIAGLSREVRGHDPLAALDGGSDGMCSYRAIAEQAPRLLPGGGEVALEIGAGQGRTVAAILAANGFTFVSAANDLAGIERALLFRRDA